MLNFTNRNSKMYPFETIFRFYRIRFIKCFKYDVSKINMIASIHVSFLNGRSDIIENKKDVFDMYQNEKVLL